MSFNYSSMVPLLGNINNNANYIPQLNVAAAVAAAHNGQIPSHLTGPPTQILTSGTATTTVPAGLNDSPLEFKNNNNKILSIGLINSHNGNIAGGDNQQNQLFTKQQQQNTKNQIQGAGPMDLENDNEIINNTTISIAAEINKRLAKRENKCNSINLDDESSMTTNDSLNSGCGGGNNGQSIQQQKSTALLMGNEMFLNGMLGGISSIGSHALPHQGFMMMQAASMMMDPTSMALQLQQQYPMLQTQTVPTVTTNPLTTQSQLQQQHSATQLQPPQQQQQSVNSHDSQTQQQQQQNLPMKEIITCKTCTLYPPNPNAPPPTIRERPPGCRTVFVGGLPESITEEIIREIFESCGEITTLRLSKKNFCHIRFVFEASVDSAIYLSGYRIRIANSQDSINCGRLHVDYAQARDDQYEWECKQRQLQREQRHRERMERDRLRSLSPPPIVHYTEHEASTIAEKLKNDESFTKAVQTLIAWLERGDCSKKNANTFYTMIQSTNAHVRRLQSDKNEFEEELKKARENYRKQMLSMAQQFTQIEKVFNAASHKKVWDHFTKAQRKNIDQWKKLSMEMRSVQIEDDEMEMSDDDRDYRSSSSKRSRYDNEHLKDENDSLRCQLEVCKNEMTLVKSDQKSDTDVRDKQLKVLQETIRNLQTQLLENKSKEKEFTTKITDLEDKLKQANVKELLLKTKIANNRISSAAATVAAVTATVSTISSSTSSTTLSSINYVDDLVDRKTQLINNNNSNNVITNNLEENQKNVCNNDDTDQLVDTTDTNSKQTNNTQTKSDKIDDLIDDARIIALVSTFLVVHPFGASPDYICSYLQKTHPNLRSRDLEEILGKYRCIFYEEITGIGMKIERKWKFCGFCGYNEQQQIEQQDKQHQKNV